VKFDDSTCKECLGNQKWDATNKKCVDCSANEERDATDVTKCACKSTLQFAKDCSGNCKPGYYPKETCDKKCLADEVSDGSLDKCKKCLGAEKGAVPDKE